MEQFISGTIMMGYIVAGLFFLRFWRESHDRLFAMFAVAFWVLAVNRLGFAFISESNEARTLFYLVRLLAFIIILVAILDKNRTGR